MTVPPHFPHHGNLLSCFFPSFSTFFVLYERISLPDSNYGNSNFHAEVNEAILSANGGTFLYVLQDEGETEELDREKLMFFLLNVCMLPLKVSVLLFQVNLWCFCRERVHVRVVPSTNLSRRPLQKMENENYIKSSQFFLSLSLSFIFVIFLKYKTKKCNNDHQAAGVTRHWRSLRMACRKDLWITDTFFFFLF